MSEVNTVVKPEFAKSGPVPTNLADGGRHEQWTVRSSGSDVRIDQLDDGSFLIHCLTHGNWTIEKVAHEAWVRKTNPHEWCEGCYDAKAEKDAAREAKQTDKADKSSGALKKALARATDPAQVAGLELAIANALPRPRILKGSRGEAIIVATPIVEVEPVIETAPEPEVVEPVIEVPEPVETPEPVAEVPAKRETQKQSRARKARERRAAKANESA